MLRLSPDWLDEAESTPDRQAALRGGFLLVLLEKAYLAQVSGDIDSKLNIMAEEKKTL